MRGFFVGFLLLLVLLPLPLLLAVTVFFVVVVLVVAVAVVGIVSFSVFRCCCCGRSIYVDFFFFSGLCGHLPIQPCASS